MYCPWSVVGVVTVVVLGMERVAIIDLGSNTSKLILMEYDKGKSYRQVDELRQVVRLAEGMASANVLRADAMQRGLEALVTFKAYCDAAGVTDIRATATSAVREADNGDTFINLIEQQIGFVPQIISGENEAKFEAIAVANSMPFSDAYIFDIGGGSAELSLLEGRQLKRGASIQLGAVIMTEKFFENNPPKKKEVKALKKHIRELLKGIDAAEGFASDLPLVGMGGTLRNLAKIHKKQTDYPLDLLNTYQLPKDDLAAIVDDLVDKTVAEKRSVSGLKTDRADIITAGAVVALELLEYAGADAYTIASQGLREGVFYEALIGEDNPLLDDVRSFSIRNLEHHYYPHTAHNEHVQKLALELFDCLQELHDYGDWERELLGYAALLHDIGMAVNYNDHHQHGFYLLLSAELPGFTHREQALLALLVRYHRKGMPDTMGLGALLAADDSERVTKLVSLLRLAEYLERSKAQLIRGLTCHVSKGYVQINVDAKADVGVELREARLNSELLKTAFGVEVEIVDL